MPFSGLCGVVVRTAINNHDRPAGAFGGRCYDTEAAIEAGCAVQRGNDYGQGGQRLTPEMASLTLYITFYQHPAESVSAEAPLSSGGAGAPQMYLHPGSPIAEKPYFRIGLPGQGPHQQQS